LRLFGRTEALSAPGGSGPHPSGSALGRGLTHAVAVNAKTAVVIENDERMKWLFAAKVPDHSAEMSDAHFPRLRRGWNGSEERRRLGVGWTLPVRTS
jgi:hypothetical protein